jgi:hypothetical protein
MPRYPITPTEGATAKAILKGEDTETTRILISIAEANRELRK